MRSWDRPWVVRAASTPSSGIDGENKHTNKNDDNERGVYVRVCGVLFPVRRVFGTGHVRRCHHQDPLIPQRRTWVAWVTVLVAVLAAWGPPGICGFSTTPPPQQPPRSLEPLQGELVARRVGEIFVDAILNQPFETLPNKREEGAAEGEMRLWRNIPDREELDDIEDLEDLEEGKGLVNIVRRSILEPFWQSCIDGVDIVKGRRRYRVCAVGTPGIGKTYTTPLLLRMLLLKNSSVVYIRRTVEASPGSTSSFPRPPTSTMER